MSVVKRIASLFGRGRTSKGKPAGPESPEESDLINAVIMRIEVEGEDHSAAPPADEGEGWYRRLMQRLDWQLQTSGIGAEELIRTYPGEASALLLSKSYEGGRKKKAKAETAVLRERLVAMGFKLIQPSLWILPPSKTPTGLSSQEALKLWFRQGLAKGTGKSVVYVFPFIAVVDLKKVVSERRGIRKLPAARTLFSVLTPDEVAPPSHVYATMKARGHSVRDIIVSGDLSFLSSAFAHKEELEQIRARELEIGQRLRHATGASAINLEDIANLGPDSVATAFEGVVGHPKDFAQRMVVEAQYWMRFLGGTVPE